uniref:Uncharacterized protein n=1 Tax=Aegilops tauschii subsp. strangulata TaxID=200361 RepID=A0A452Z893_AEGTS
VDEVIRDPNTPLLSPRWRQLTVVLEYFSPPRDGGAKTNQYVALPELLSSECHLRQHGSNLSSRLVPHESSTLNSIDHN